MKTEIRYNLNYPAQGNTMGRDERGKLVIQIQPETSV